MSSELPPKGAAPAYDEAEKGALDVHIRPVEVAFNDEKKDLTVTQVLPVSPPVKEAQPPPAKAPGKPAKRKISRWILWQLWYDMYRYGV